MGGRSGEHDPPCSSLVYHISYRMFWMKEVGFNVFYENSRWITIIYTKNAIIYTKNAFCCFAPSLPLPWSNLELPSVFRCWGLIKFEWDTNGKCCRNLFKYYQLGNYIETWFWKLTLILLQRISTMDDWLIDIDVIGMKMSFLFSFLEKECLHRVCAKIWVMLKFLISISMHKKT